MAAPRPFLRPNDLVIILFMIYKIKGIKMSMIYPKDKLFFASNLVPRAFAVIGEQGWFFALQMKIIIEIMPSYFAIFLFEFLTVMPNIIDFMFIF